MTNKRTGTIIGIEMFRDQGCSKVYKFQLDSDPSEDLTVAISTADASETPQLNDQVMVFLHPSDSKWAKHATRLINHVPDRVIVNS